MELSNIKKGRYRSKRRHSNIRIKKENEVTNEVKNEMEEESVVKTGVKSLTNMKKVK